MRALDPDRGDSPVPRLTAVGSDCGGVIARDCPAVSARWWGRNEVLADLLAFAEEQMGRALGEVVAPSTGWRSDPIMIDGITCQGVRTYI